MVLRGVLCVVGRMGVMAVGQVRMVSRGLMVSVAMVFCGFVVVTRSVFVVLRCLGVMLSCFVRHE
jgi:hypothetical protein